MGYTFQISYEFHLLKFIIDTKITAKWIVPGLYSMHFVCCAQIILSELELVMLLDIK